MKSLATGLLLAFAIALPALSTASTETAFNAANDASRRALAEEIDMAEWSLRHSSVSKVTPISVLDVSISTLNRARQELTAGNVRTARELLQRASQPLSHMTYSAMEGRHPDEQSRMRETRETLESLIDAAERIAAEKNAPDEFIVAARQALRQKDALLAAGNEEAAQEVLQQAYAAVSRRIAELRSGDSFYIAAPAGATDENWRDGLRRIDERREITRYILLEATAEGLDVAPLVEGAKSAEVLVSNASVYADQHRWDLALVTLDRAYDEYEQSWRAVGVEW